MTFVFNTVIALLIVITVTLVALHYYPVYQPQSPAGWVGMFAVGTFVIVVAEAIADNAKFLHTWPKTQRLFVVALIVSVVALSGLYYLTRGHF